MLELWLLLEASCCYTYSEYAMKNEEVKPSSYLRLQELVTVKAILIVIQTQKNSVPPKTKNSVV